MLRTCRRLCPRARVGLHTNLPAETTNALRRIDAEIEEVSAAASPQAQGLEEAFRSLRAHAAEGFRITAEVAVAPAVVHRLALADPGRWSQGADALLVGAAAEPGLWNEHLREHESCWQQAFPGLASVAELA